jgi:uncharacterized protein (TIGR01244 family)
MRPSLLALALVALSPLHSVASTPVEAGTAITSDPAGASPSGSATKFVEPAAGLRTGGQPDARDLAQLHAQGVRTVIDLRATGEDRGFDEAAEVARLGMTYVALPIAGKDDITPENAQALQVLLREHGDGTLVHCASGNRVGALLALGAARSGASHEEALALGHRAGLTSLEPVVAAQLDAGGAPSPE